MKNLYISRVDDFITVDKPDVKLWKDIYTFTAPSFNTVDRCGSIKMPWNFKLYEPFSVPRDLSNFNLTYEECCEKRASELVELSRKLDKPITVFYSGGIDSTGVLVSFMKTLNKQELKQRIRVALSIESIQENHNFYYEFIRPNCNIISSEYLSSTFDGSTIIVGGELNDQLFGSEIVIMGEYRHGTFEEIKKPLSREFVVNWHKKFMPESSANIWYDLITEQFNKNPICELKTNFDFFWWYNFNFKWQNTFFRQLLMADRSLRHKFNKEFVENYYHQFYATEDFQKWSMLNPHLKIPGDYNTYKLSCKKMIFDFNKDEKYFNYKTKFASLFRLFLQKKYATAMSDNFEFLDKIEPMEYYNPDNSMISRSTSI